MYKDREKQKEANRQAQARRRQQGMTKGMTSEGMTQEGVTDNVIPETKLGYGPIDQDLPANLELCRTCTKPLPPLEKPRQYPGRCIDCIKGGYA